jgi:hypothetical protein
MKVIIITALLAILTVLLVACKKTKEDPPPVPPDTVEAEPATAIKLTQDDTGTWFFEITLKAPQNYTKTVQISAKYIAGPPITHLILIPKGSTFVKYPLPIQYGAVMSYSVLKWGKWEG